MQYQGENFLMECEREFVRIWDPAWNGIQANDPNMLLYYEAFNYANFGYGPTIIMSDPNDQGIITVHSRIDIRLQPECPGNEQYVKMIFDSFFAAKERAYRTFQQRVAEKQGKEEKQQKSRRPIGFTTDSLSFSNE